MSRFFFNFGRVLGSHVGPILKDFRGLWTVLDCDVGFGGFNIDFPGFWSILGDFWGAMLEPFWNPKRTKMEQKSRFLPFFRASKRKAVTETLSGPFSQRLERAKMSKSVGGFARIHISARAT